MATMKSRLSKLSNWVAYSSAGIWCSNAYNWLAESTVGEACSEAYQWVATSRVAVACGEAYDWTATQVGKAAPYVRHVVGFILPPVDATIGFTNGFRAWWSEENYSPWGTMRTLYSNKGKDPFGATPTATAALSRIGTIVATTLLILGFIGALVLPIPGVAPLYAVGVAAVFKAIGITIAWSAVARTASAFVGAIIDFFAADHIMKQYRQNMNPKSKIGENFSRTHLVLNMVKTFLLVTFFGEAYRKVRTGAQNLYRRIRGDGDVPDPAAAPLLNDDERGNEEQSVHSNSRSPSGSFQEAPEPEPVGRNSAQIIQGLPPIAPQTSESGVEQPATQPVVTNLYHRPNAAKPGAAVPCPSLLQDDQDDEESLQFEPF